MGKCWVCLFLVAVAVGLERNLAEADGVKPMNVTATPSSRSVEIRWKVPSFSSSVVSYRVRIYPSADQERMWVHWVPGREVQNDLHETISCLEPSTLYNVQVFARFTKSSNVTDCGSQVVRVTTKNAAQLGFLEQVWEQKMYVMIGAILAVVVMLFFTPCLCLYFARKRKGQLHTGRDSSSRMTGRRKTSRDNSLPSATELQNRERFFDYHNDSRYSKDPVQGLDFHSRSGSSANEHAFSTHTLPPSYLQATPCTAPLPVEQARGRRPVPLPESGSESDDDDYQNDVFGPGPDTEMYANQAFLPPPQPETNIYGNMQY